MNRSLLRRIGSFLFVFYVLGFGVFFVYALVRVSPETVLPSLRWTYALERGFALFMQYLLPIHAAAIAVAASLSTSGGAARSGSAAESFSRIVSPTLATFLVLSVAYTLAFEIGYPAARRGLQDMRASSALARQLFKQAQAFQQSGDYRAGLDLIDRYLRIDKDNAAAARLRVALESQAARKAAPAQTRSAVDSQAAEGMGAQTLIDKARSAFDRQDWFAAHYYAQLASSRDPRRTDALRLAADAAEKMSASEGAQSGQTGAELFKEKKDAYLQLVGRNYLEAYYRFAALSKRYPKDPDVATYLAEAGRNLQGVSFFLDEAQRVQPMPGTERILFFNRTDPGSLEAVAIGKMVQVREGTYFLDVEAVRYDAMGRVAWHLSAPYGKLENGTIVMQCIDRNDPGLRFLPVYVAGGRSAQERNVLPVGPSAEQMRSLSTSSAALADLGPVDLWRIRKDLSGLGFSPSALALELMMQLAMPFAFLVLSLFALALGWAFRVRAGDRIGFLGAVLTPLVPLVMAILSLLYVYAHRIVLGFSVLAFGSTPAFLIGAALELVLLFIALALLAGQSGS